MERSAAGVGERGMGMRRELLELMRERRDALLRLRRSVIRRGGGEGLVEVEAARRSVRRLRLRRRLQLLLEAAEVCIG